jgi:pyridoxal phosphate enzyme (YggS family)
MNKHRLLKMSLEYTKERQAELIHNYSSVLSRIEQTPRPLSNQVQLIAVSKLKPASDIKALYDYGVRHFGENYAQELISKAEILPRDIKWHFIGGLQTNKCKDLNKIENLYAVQTVDSLKKCKKLNDSREGEKVNVFVQINTSGEEQKSGLLPDNSELKEIVEYLQSSPNLQLIGLMTIGSFEQSHDKGDNKEFSVLYNLKTRLDKEYGVNLQLSMGMSSDFEQATKQGTSFVRVGTDIFGARPPRA